YEFSAFRAERLEAHIGDVHDRRNRGDARLILLWIELKRIELWIARDDELNRLISRTVQEWLFSRQRIPGLRSLTEVGPVSEQRAFKQRPFWKSICARDSHARRVFRIDDCNRPQLCVRKEALA